MKLLLVLFITFIAFSIKTVEATQECNPLPSTSRLPDEPPQENVPIAELPRLALTVESRIPVLGQDYDSDTHRYDPRFVNPESYNIFIDAFPGEEIIRVICDPEPPQGGGRAEPIETLQLKVPSDTEVVDLSIKQVDGQFSKSRSTMVRTLTRTRRGSEGMPPPSKDIWTWNVSVPGEGTFDITVKLRNQDGNGPQKTQRVTLRDFLIVSLGDSYASGQGNPDEPGSPTGFDVDLEWWEVLVFPIALYKASKEAADTALDILKREFTTISSVVSAEIDMDPDPVWLEKNAYRSLRSGPALAAQALEDRRNGRMITFLSFARSGSTIPDGLIGPHKRDVFIPDVWLEDSDLRALCGEVLEGLNEDNSQVSCHDVLEALTGASGQQFEDLNLRSICDEVFGTSCNLLLDVLNRNPYKGRFVRVPDAAWIGNTGQIEEAKRTLGDQRIDALLISIGGNDTGFASSLTDMIKEDIINSDTNERRKIRRRADKRLSELPAAFDNLEKALTTLNVRHVYLSEYPTSLFDRKNRQPEGGCEIFSSYFDADVTPADARLIMEIGEKLNNILRQEAEDRGWFFVDGIADSFRGHGYCTPPDDRMFVQAAESLVLQGDMQGTMHPNALGHTAYAEQIISMVEENTIMMEECASPTEFFCFLFAENN